MKVARTIADLLGQDRIDKPALTEAANFRAVDPTADVFATPPPDSTLRPLIARVRISDSESATVVVDDESTDGIDLLPVSVRAPNAPTPDELAVASRNLPSLPSPP